MKNLKIAVDVIMYADFLFLMSKGNAGSPFIHGIAGILLFCLFILHHVLNRSFYKAAFSRKSGSTWNVLSVTDLILLLLIVVMAFSSVMMSGMSFSFSPVGMTMWSRKLHTFSSSWCFLVMSFHLGLHLSGKIGKLKLNAAAAWVMRILLLLAGLFCIIYSQLYVYLFLLGNWKMAAPNVFACIAELLCESCAMMVLADIVMKMLKRK